jgi:hypothetical protein
VVLLDHLYVLHILVWIEVVVGGLLAILASSELSIGLRGCVGGVLEAERIPIISLLRQKVSISSWTGLSLGA